MNQLINFKALQEAIVYKTPYPYFTVEKSINSDFILPTLHDFPAIEDGGSFTLDTSKPGPMFNALIAELNSEAFRESISSKLEINLTKHPMIVTLRGISRAKDGRVHTDSKSKIATVLIYFNYNWSSDRGKLRILNSNNIDDMAVEVTPNASTLLAFKVTDNCWHGYPAYEGQRRSIQINFVADERAIKKHYNRHGWTAAFKRLFSSTDKHKPRSR